MLGVLLVLAVIDDLRRYRISNRLIIAGGSIGVGLCIADSICGVDIFGYIGGAALAGGLMLVAYTVRAVGAGDVKLSAVCGLLLGYEYVCSMLIVSFLSAGVLGVAKLCAGGGDAVAVGKRKLHRLHFSVGILIGCIWVVFGKGVV